MSRVLQHDKINVFIAFLNFQTFFTHKLIVLFRGKRRKKDFDIEG